MTNLTPEQIREAVELADGFTITDRAGGNRVDAVCVNGFPNKPFAKFCENRVFIAALASQLISQLENAGYRVTVYGAYVSIEGSGRDCDYKGRAHKRDENSILACTELFRSLK